MSRKRKYSNEFRLKIISEYLSSQFGGFKRIGKKYGIHHSIVKGWVHRYELHGAEGLFKTSGSYSSEFKIYVIEYMHANNMSLNETAHHFCIPSTSTVAKWERQYYEEGAEVSAP